MSDETTAINLDEINDVLTEDNFEEAGQDYGDPKPFLAVWTTDEYVPGRNGVQYHYVMKGKVGKGHQRWADRKLTKEKTLEDGTVVPGKINVNTKFGKIAQSIFATFPGVAIGKGKLVGKIVWVSRTDITFGMKTNKETGLVEEMVARDVLLIIREATPEEAATLTSDGTPAPIASLKYSEEEIENLLDLYDGKTPAQVKRGVLTNRDLSREMKNAVSSGEALKYLEGEGLLEADEEGTYRVLVAA